MLKLLERNISAIERRLILLAPHGAKASGNFKHVISDTSLHRRMVKAMQGVRGSVYLKEGNLAPHQLSPEGLHQTPEDERSWHLVMTTPSGDVSSCAWYLAHGHAPSPEQLRMRSSPLNHSAEWKEKLHSAVRADIRLARRDGLHYAEVGGWAVPEHRRRSADCVMLALAAYGLSRRLGGCIAITTANVQHGSSSILRRLGGSNLESDGDRLPPYFDPKYNATIELLRFDSRTPDRRYQRFIEMLTARITDVPVVAPSAVAAPVAQVMSMTAALSQRAPRVEAVPVTARRYVGNAVRVGVD